MNAFLGRSGKVSMMRVLVSVTVGTVLAVWVAGNIICWCKGCPSVPMDTASVSLILGALAAKAGQRMVERDSIPKDLTQ